MPPATVIEVTLARTFANKTFGCAKLRFLVEENVVRKSCSDYFDGLTASDLHKKIRVGAENGKLYEIMIGEREYSYVVGSFARNMFMFDQDPNMILMHLHWLVGEGVIRNSDVKACIHKILNEKQLFRLGMEYIREYLENYKSDDWFPQHPLEIDCNRLISNIHPEVKSNLTEDEKYYLSHFNRQHPELAVDF